MYERGLGKNPEIEAMTAPTTVETTILEALGFK